MRRLGLILGYFFVGACSSAPSGEESLPRSCGGRYALKLDARLDEGWKSAARHASTRWGSMVGASFQEAPGSPEDEATCTVQVLLEDPGKGHFGEARTTFDSEGRLFASTIVVTLSPTRTELQEGTMMHEFGHALGLPHDTDSTHRSVMWPYIQATTSASCPDWQRACAIWRCEAACQGGGWLP